MRHIGAFALGLAIAAGCQEQGPWRSSLYPENWTPGYEDSKGRFLHDFSYAGYRRGEAEIPANPPGAVVDVTKPPYSADATGAADATAKIQSAIDAVGAAGGGVVYLPAGTYRVQPQGEDKAALWIHHSKVVLRGDGPAATKLFNDSTQMRFKEVIRVSPVGDHDHHWVWQGEPGIAVTHDVPKPTKTLTLETAEGLSVGDWVVVRSDATPEFISDHGMTGTWTESVGGITLYRRIEAIDGATITIDIPTRYWMLKRDHVRVYTTIAHIEEVGVEELSIEMKKATGSLKDNDYDKPGTASYACHQAHAVKFNYVVNGWMRHVNAGPVLSMGVQLVSTRSVTLDSCRFQDAQYKGAGGNGYLFAMQGGDNLVRNCEGIRGRHNFSFAGMQTSGNVLLQCTAKDGRLPCDFHMHLSAANLIDGMKMDGDYWSAIRRTHADHGHATSQSVFWNLKGVKQAGWNHLYVLETGQFGWGYVFGTSGKVPRVNSKDDTELVEGKERGADLVPASLYLDQLERRLEGP